MSILAHFGRRSRLILLIAGLALVFIWTIGGPLAQRIWFDSVGFVSVWNTQFGYGLGLFVIGTLLSGAWLLLNTLAAWRLADDPGDASVAGKASVHRRDDYYHDDSDLDSVLAAPWDAWRIMSVILIAVLAILSGFIWSGSWQTVALYINQVGTGGIAANPDPIFGLPMSWWMFSLPFLHLVINLIAVMVVLAILISGALYLLANQRGAQDQRRAYGHLAILAGFGLLVIAIMQLLGAFGLSYTHNGVVTGVTATDAAIRLPLAYITSFASLLAAIGAFVWALRHGRRLKAAIASAEGSAPAGKKAAAALAAAAGKPLAGHPLLAPHDDDDDLEAFTRGLARRAIEGRGRGSDEDDSDPSGSMPRSRLVLGGLIAYVILLVAGFVLPTIYQTLIVSPNENSAEAPYITNNIAMTRSGFGIAGWTVNSYAGSSDLSAADVSADQATLDNARLWDYRPLSSTLDQLQTIRQYYGFNDVDIDRYLIGGKQTEVMLSVRDMTAPNSSWINQHVLYTHGYGAAMVPVNAVDSNGLPDLIVKNMPVTSSPGAPTLSQPGVYFSEQANDWVLVGAKSDEFDYPSSAAAGGNDVTSRYTGSAGIGIGSAAARLFWAWQLGDFNLLVSDQVTTNTKVLINRSLSERLGLLAPFLTLDSDPYAVIGPNGHLMYIQDAYTTTSAIPDAPKYNLDGSSVNYVRNSVKITMDAYDGSMHFYIADPSDPIINTWAKVFQGLFEPLSAMPAGLAAHLRTPENMFDVQTAVFARYHVTDPASFYKNDDLWALPTVTEGNTQVLPPQSYYVEMRLPGQTTPEFILIQPMVPTSRPNMIAWVAARNDSPNLGQVVVYRLPSDTTIYGPTQIEARIDQDPTISAQISLWNQSGSTVIRGNLLVIPVGSSFLYLEPLYLQSTASAFPQLTKVVLATSSKVAWGDTLDQALSNILSGAGTGPSPSTGPTSSPGPSASATPGPTGLPSTIEGLAAYADQHFTAAKAAYAAGDFVTYGQELVKVQAALAALDQLTHGGLSSPVPSGTPGSPSPTPSGSSAPLP